ncbi:UDP-glucuronosyltransferase 1A1 isoform X1 [Folsomia candida]|uniref:UDP-glucuronosyltransferase 1A1 isoform X1 n=2 Tax=Folsomia candida TaxID=158441 RepID=UPI0016054AE7|nr:UDP-glucuronosyltransferase 1A1 isoform X1 [Folsomia candida]
MSLIMMRKTALFLLTGIFISFTCRSSEAANILFFFGLSSYSHRIAAWPLTEALAARGHKVTFLSPYPAKTPSPNVTDYVPVCLKEWVDTWDEIERFNDLRLSGEMELEWYKISEYGTGMCDVLLADPVFVSWIKDSPKFDLFIIDALINECAYGMAHVHGAKVIVYNTAIPFPWYIDPFGFPDESAWVPDFVFHYPPATINFAQRAMALFNPIYFNFIREMQYFPKLEATLRSTLSPEMPSLSALERNVSLLFINQHPAEDYARPFPPNVIPLPGLHCGDSQKAAPLTSDLSSFIGDSPFIYVSFGSYVDISNFGTEATTVFRNVLNRLGSERGLKVVWKIGSERPEGLGDHVHTGKWMPQQAILAHPKIRAFVTHAGLLGIQEAICNSVPLIAFPIFAEQDYNANKLEYRKVGVQLEITAIREDKFWGAIGKVLDDQSYALNMKRLSTIFLDRAVHPVDTGVWWVEYVLRHDDVSHLRPRSVHLPWWKKRQLDIWGAIFLAILAILKFLHFLLKAIFKLVCLARGPKDKAVSKLKLS